MSPGERRLLYLTYGVASVFGFLFLVLVRMWVT